MIFNRRSILAAACAAAFSFTAGVPARALTPYRVADVDPTFRSAGSNPGGFVRVGSRALFLARTPGLGLWSSDGTAAGNVRLLRNQVSIDYLTATRELLFFYACDPQRCRLQATDGTVAGTRALAAPFFSQQPSAVAGPRRIFFARYTEATGSELWTSDATPVGTRLVKDLVPGPEGSAPSFLVWFRDRLWFFAQNALWTTDGSAAGTRRIATVGAPGRVGTAGARLLFYATAPGSPAVARFWSSDGTAAGTRLLTAVPAQEAPLFDPFTSTGPEAYFFAQLRDATGSFYFELWASDGTPGRSRKLARFDGGVLFPTLIAAGPRVSFIATDAAHGLELWSSDGRPGGTRSLDVCPGACSGVSELGVSDGQRIWFAGRTDQTGEELWRSDLTPAGTRLIKDLAPGPLGARPVSFLLGGGKAFFSTRSASRLEELWVSDATANGTRRLALQAEEGLPFGLGTILGTRAFFSRTDVVHGAEPWVSDGTVAGTTILADLDPNQDGGSFPKDLRAGAGRCFFFANSRYPEIDLWSSDGTEAGTLFAHRFDGARFSSSFRIGSADLGSRIALVDTQFTGLSEIWISDGTEGGTFRAHSDDLRPTGRFRAAGGRLFFEASDTEHGLELWTTDGTPAGTLRLSDFTNQSPFPNESTELAPFRVLGNRLSFLAADAFGRFEPWVSDGTIGGTRRLAEVYPALVAPFFEVSSEIVPVGDKYFFVSGEQSEVGTEPALWVTDLTVDGTRKVAALVDSRGERASEVGLYAVGSRVILFYRGGFDAGFWSSDGTSFTLGAVGGAGLAFESIGALTPVLLGNRLVYRGTDNYLYATDGSAAGTVRLLGANGQPVFVPSAFALLGSRLSYATFEGIWETDGTPTGTVRLLKPRTTLEGTEFLPVAERIFFPWYEPTTGTEIWALRP